MITQPPPEIDLARRRVRARPRWEIGSPELTLLWLACALASMGLAGYGIHRAVQLWRAAPIGDEWMGVAFYRAWTDRTVTFSGWIAQHNEHRLPFARLLLLVDYLSFGGRAIFSHVANLASYVGLGIALGVIITRHVADRAERAMVIAASVALLVAPAQIANLAFPFQIQMSLVCLLALAAFFATARLGAPATRHAQWAATAVAAVATLLAPYASANGLAASVMAAALAVAIDRPSRLIISAAAALAVGSFFYGYQVPQQGADLLARLQTPAAPANVATFALSFVGSWAQRQGAGAAIALGVAGVALWGAAAVHCTLLWRRHALDAATLTLLALGAFVLASALMAAYGAWRNRAMPLRRATGPSAACSSSLSWGLRGGWLDE